MLHTWSSHLMVAPASEEKRHASPWRGRRSSFPARKLRSECHGLAAPSVGSGWNFTRTSIERAKGTLWPWKEQGIMLHRFIFFTQKLYSCHRQYAPVVRRLWVKINDFSPQNFLLVADIITAPECLLLVTGNMAFYTWQQSSIFLSGARFTNYVCGYL